jgi:hypothetical protein
VNQLGFVSSYSPIQDDGKGMNSAGVPYYGMLAFATALAGCHQLLPLEPGSGSDSLHAYVFGASGKPRSAVVISMGTATEARVSLGGLGMKSARVLRLTAPSADSKIGVLFGGTQVGENGRWRAASGDRIGGGELTVPPMSAAVVLATHG